MQALAPLVSGHPPPILTFWYYCNWNDWGNTHIKGGNPDRDNLSRTLHLQCSGNLGNIPPTWTRLRREALEALCSIKVWGTCSAAVCLWPHFQIPNCDQIYLDVVFSPLAGHQAQPLSPAGSLVVKSCQRQKASKTRAPPLLLPAPPPPSSTCLRNNWLHTAGVFS